MASFGDTSQRRMEDVHSDLCRLMWNVVDHYDCTVNYNGGHRGKELQDDLFPTHTKVQWPNSKHNCMLFDSGLAGDWIPCSLGIDVMPYHKFEPHIDWGDRDGFYHFAGYVRCKANELDIPIVWGGDWDMDFDLDDQDFYDLAHFNLDTRVEPYKSIWEAHLDANR